MIFKKEIFACFIFVLSINNLFGDSWSQKSNLDNIYRVYTYTFSINGKGYVFGGMDSLQVLHNDLWEYDPSNDSWTQKASLSSAVRYAGCGFTVDNKGYICGGKDSKDSVLKDVWCYDPLLDQWTQKTSMLLQRALPSCFVINNIAYVGFGEINNNYDYTNTWESYNPVTDKWNSISDYPGSPRFGAVAFSIGNVGFGGLGDDGGSVFDDWYEYNPSLTQWNIKNFPLPDYVPFSLTNFSLGNYGYLIFPVDILAGPHNKLYRYDPQSDSWSYKTPFPGQGGEVRAFTFSFVIGNNAYVGQGEDPDNLFYNDLWMYTPDDVTGITQEDMTKNITISPNPFNDKITLNSFASKSAKMLLNVFDVSGKKVFERGTILKEQEIDLSFLKSGVYFVKVLKDGKTSVQRIVKI